jgi:hypothetical protein
MPVSLIRVDCRALLIAVLLMPPRAAPDDSTGHCHRVLARGQGSNSQTNRCCLGEELAHIGKDDENGVDHRASERFGKLNANALGK